MSDTFQAIEIVRDTFLRLFLPTKSRSIMEWLSILKYAWMIPAFLLINYIKENNTLFLLVLVNISVFSRSYSNLKQLVVNSSFKIAFNSISQIQIEQFTRAILTYFCYLQSFHVNIFRWKQKALFKSLSCFRPQQIRESVSSA